MQQSVDDRQVLIDHLRQEKETLSSEQQAIKEGWICEKDALIEKAEEQTQKVFELQQSVDERWDLLERLRQENAQLSNERTKIKEEWFLEKESSIHMHSEQQQQILELQQSVVSKQTTIETLRISKKEVETRLEERSGQNTKLETETVRLRGELSDMMQGLISSARTSSSDSDGTHSPWEMILADGVSSQAAKVVERKKKEKKVRRSLKNRRPRPTLANPSIPETAGEYQD